MSRTLKITERCRAVWLCLTRRQRECRSLFHHGFTTRSQRQASSKIPSKPRRRMPARLKEETRTLKTGAKRLLTASGQALAPHASPQPRSIFFLKNAAESGLFPVNNLRVV
ncbi:hypothetical protein ASPTUDRAFT_692010 [Aspergillus tubingensis CBS 134.48]|uniref:Uncharacterized protein n=1 Tax=Aspergillus tubingensis (strain CBS 134.48) TaxID=767770 RepID=A0A1L9N0F4_ASPTC|nr:hypothetical protein ASPTUDRAFT_692010 [Aspergillus tubingensis CBS 134.48]